MRKYITDFTRSLIEKAKQTARDNEIKKREKEQREFDKALCFIHEHLDSWYQEHIKEMERNYRCTDPCRFGVYDCPDWVLDKLSSAKRYKYSCYIFELANCSIFKKEYLLIKVKA
jgi:hypothetical protein